MITGNLQSPKPSISTEFSAKEGGKYVIFGLETKAENEIVP